MEPKEQLSPNPTDIIPIITPFNALDPNGFAPIIVPLDVRNGSYALNFVGPVARFIINRQVVSISMISGPSTVDLVDPSLAYTHATLTYGPSNTAGVQVIKEVQTFRVMTIDDAGAGLPGLLWQLSGIKNITIPSSLYGRDRWVCEVRLFGFAPTIPISAVGANGLAITIQVS